MPGKNLTIVLQAYGFIANCQARIVGQDKHCKRCGYVWDITDQDPPKCKSEAAVKRERVAQLRELLK